MKRINGFWVIGITALAMAAISAWPASASALTLKIEDDKGHSITVPDVGLFSQPAYSWLDRKVGSIGFSMTFYDWTIYDVATSNNGPTATDPDWVSLTSVNTGPVGGKLWVTVSQQFSNANPFLDGNIYADSSYDNTGTMNFLTTVDTEKVTLAPPNPGQFTLSGQTPVFAPNNPYTVTLEYDLTSSGTDDTSRVDAYSVGVSVPTPEPATLLLLGSGLAGLAGLGALRRR